MNSHQSARTFTTIKLMTDKVYRAVIAANKALEKYKYHIVGGAAGTVSPMGWTWQGGNGGTTGDRLYGTCVYLLSCPPLFSLRSSTAHV